MRTATFDMPEHGLTEEVLTDTDVLIFWSHALQDAFSDEVAERVQKHVLAGMGLIALHSAHFSKIMKRLLGTSMTLKWKHGEQENLWCLAPTHPIAAGIPEKIFLPKEEMYGEYFDIPKPDEVILRVGFPADRYSAAAVRLQEEWERFFIFSRVMKNIRFTMYRKFSRSL